MLTLPRLADRAFDNPADRHKILAAIVAQQNSHRATCYVTEAGHTLVRNGTPESANVRISDADSANCNFLRLHRQNAQIASCMSWGSQSGDVTDVGWRPSKDACE